jgi:endonuclease YncB( thermonuclease family)
MTLLLPDYRYDLSEVIRVKDGDTFVARVSRDAGFYLTNHWTLEIRVADIDCPEMKIATRAAAIAARDFTATWLAAEPCLIETVAKRLNATGTSATGATSFERWVAHVRRADGSSLADALVEAGHGVRVL